MSRKPLIRSNVFPYHVTGRSNNREQFHLSLGPLENIWKELSHQCFEVSLLYGAKIHAFVLMPNHFHLLISTPNEDLGEVMQHWMRSGTQSLNRIYGRSGHIFGSSYHWTLVDSPIYYGHAFKYVYRNPVRANICSSVQEYPYSTLCGLLGTQRLQFPVYFPFQEISDINLPSDFNELIEWLNKPFKTEHQEAIQRAMRRTRYQPPKQGWKRSLEELKTSLL